MHVRAMPISMLAALALLLSGCQATDPTPPTATVAPASTPASATPTMTPTPTLAPMPDPGPVMAPAPTSCDDIGTADGRAAWEAQGFTLEPFDGVLVGGPVGYTDALAPHLSVHCALWSPEREFGAYLLIEWYVAIDAAAFLSQPFLADYQWADIPTDIMTMTVVGSELDGVVGSAEYLVAHEDTLLRVFSNGFDVTSAGPNGFDMMQLVVQGVWHEVE